MDKKVLIIGGSGGIGTAIVLKFLKNDFNVIVGDIQKPKLDVIPSELHSMLSYNYLDVRNEISINDFFEFVDKSFHCIDHLISLAGGALRKEFKGLKLSSYDVISESININLISHVYLTKVFTELLEASNNDNKSITYISSINAIKDYGLPAYSAAKAGLIGLVNSISGELGDKKIRVNTILPGTVITPRTNKEPKDFDEYTKGSVLGRLPTTNEIAEVVFCISEFMTCVTGQTIVADCGQVKKSYMG